jgi:hypothetical protein
VLVIAVEITVHSDLIYPSMNSSELKRWIRFSMPGNREAGFEIREELDIIPLNIPPKIKIFNLQVRRRTTILVAFE